LVSYNNREENTKNKVISMTVFQIGESGFNTGMNMLSDHYHPEMGAEVMRF